MTPEELESLRARYTTDSDLRRRVDEAASTEEAIAVLRAAGFDATASDIAQLSATDVELDLDTLGQVSGGFAGQNGINDFNFTLN